MPDSSDWHHHKIEKPKDDNEYFERMSRVIFMSGLNWRTLEKKWPGIKTAFHDFNVNQVARLEEPDIEALMANPEVIRNLPKIRAVTSNAQEVKRIAEQDGSFEHYLGRLDREGGEDRLRDEVSKRFAFLGKGTTVIFLFSVGIKLPKAQAEFEARHK
jgi:DNA-3-methyladenine glycosylase I